MTTRLNSNNVEIAQVTEAQRDALTAVVGMMVYNTEGGSNGQVEIWDGSKWRTTDGAIADALNPLTIAITDGTGGSPSSSSIAATVGEVFELDSASKEAAAEEKGDAAAEGKGESAAVQLWGSGDEAGPANQADKSF